MSGARSCCKALAGRAVLPGQRRYPYALLIGILTVVVVFALRTGKKSGLTDGANRRRWAAFGSFLIDRMMGKSQTALLPTDVTGWMQVREIGNGCDVAMTGGLGLPGNANGLTAG